MPDKTYHRRNRLSTPVDLISMGQLQYRRQERRILI